MRILVSGASGLIGSALIPCLRAKGMEAAVLVRRPAEADGRDRIHWNPDAHLIDVHSLSGFDAVVHLAGENIASGRWTPARKQRIYDSRVKGTDLLATALASCPAPPKTFLCSSAIGYYGDRGEEVLDETALPGRGFLAETCVAWEAAARPAADAGIRTVHLRTGVVLSRDAGMLARLLPPFRLGLGGPLGLGKAWMSWIALEDMIRVILHCLEGEGASGPVNAVAPHPVTNREFTRALAGVLRRPAVFPVPPVALRLAFGEMARELLLSSTRVVPHRLEAAGFTWRHPDMQGALKSLLG